MQLKQTALIGDSHVSWYFCTIVAGTTMNVLIQWMQMG